MCTLEQVTLEQEVTLEQDVTLEQEVHTRTGDAH